MDYPIFPHEVPYLTTDQMIEVDRAMVDDFRIELIQMMENAGRNLAHLARTRFLDGDPVGKSVVVIAGTGGNGGGALVAARRLFNWGAKVQVVLARPAEKFNSIPAHQLSILQRMQVPIYPSTAISDVTPPELVLDGLIGYSLRGAPYGSTAELIQWVNALDVPVLSLDVPSGVDAATGTVFDPAIRATGTMTLALPKEGLRTSEVEKQIGELYLADISVPPGLYAEPALGISIGPLFAQDDIIRLR